MRTSKRTNVNDRDRAQLNQIVRNGNTPQKVALRARIVLLSADGIPTGEIMHQLGTTTPTISRWRGRYETETSCLYTVNSVCHRIPRQSPFHTVGLGWKISSCCKAGTSCLFSKQSSVTVLRYPPESKIVS